MPKPCVLIDACAVIDICEIGLWGRIVGACQLAVPSVVVEEAEYYVGADALDTLSSRLDEQIAWIA